MMKNSRDLISELVKARQDLTNAEARVTELETALHSTETTAHQPSFFNTFLKRFDVRVSVGYGIIATLWILFSDQFLTILMTENLQLSAQFSLFKGLAFVWVTAIILFSLLSAELRKHKRIEQVLEHDLMHHRETEENVKKLNRTLSVLSDINQAIVRIRHIPTLFEEACKIAVDKGVFRMAWIGLLDAKTRQVIPVAHAGFTDDYLEKIDISLDDDVRGHGPAGNALRSSQVVIVNDVQNEPLMQPWLKDAQRLGYKSTAAFPLIVSGETHGILAFYNEETDFFDEQELRLLKEMAGDIAFAMDYAEQETRRQQSEVMLQNYAKRMEILHAIDIGIINATSIQSVIEVAIKQMRQIIQCQRVSLMLLDEKTNEWLIFVADVDSATSLGSGTRIPNLSSTSEEVRFGRIAITNDLRLLPDPSPAIQQLINDGLLSALHIHFVAEKQSFGSLNLFADTTHYFTDEQQEIASEIADQLAVSIRQMRLSDEILQSEGRYRLLAENMADVIWTLDVGTSRFTYMSPSIQQLRGFSPEEAMNQTLADTLTPASLQMITDSLPERIESFVAGDPQAISQAYEVEQVCKDGSTVWTEVVTTFLPNTDGSIQILGVTRDISARKQSEAELREREEWIRLSMEASDLGKWRYDIEKGVLNFDERAAKHYGFEHNRVAVDEVLARIHPEDVERFKRELSATLDPSGSSKSAMEYRILLPDGSECWLSALSHIYFEGQGTVHHAVYGFGTSQDITERKHAEETLRRTEERYRHVVEDQTDLICRYKADFKLTFVNHAYAALYDKQPDELIGINFFSLMPETDRAASQAYLTRLTPSNPVATTEHRSVLPDGSERWIQWTDRALLDETGTITEYQGVGRDITARIHTEDALRRSEEQYRSLIDSSEASISMLDANGRYLFLNAIAARPFQRPPTDLVGKTVKDLFSPGEAAQILASVKQVITENEGILLEPEVKIGGVQCWFRTSIQPVRDGAGTPYAALIHATETTEKKRAELALQKSESQQRAILSAIPDIMFRFSADGKFLDYHAPDSDLLAAAPEAFLGKKIEAVLSPELATDLSHRIQQVVATKEPVQFEYSLEVASGTREFESRLVLVGEDEVLSIVRDVTERKVAEKELQSLYDATSYLFKADSVANLGQQIVAAVTHEFEYADCGLMLLDKSHTHIQRLARSGQFDVQAGSSLLLDGKGLVPLALRTGNIVYAPDVTQDTNYVHSDARTQSEFVIPLKTANGIIGVLDLQHAEKDAFSERDRRILTAYAERAAPAIEVMQLNDELNSYAAELEQRVAQRTAELNTAKERAEAILNHSIDGVVLMDSKLVIQQTNMAFNALFGAEPDDYFGKSFAALLSVEDAEAVHKIMTDRNGQRLEITAHRKSGTVFDAEFGFGFIKNNGIVCIISDITERRGAEKAIAEERNLLRTLIDAVPDYIFVKDTQHRTVLSNLARARFDGLASPEESIGKSDYDFVPPKMAAQFHAEEDHLFQTLVPLINHEEQVVDARRGIIWASTSKVPLHNLNGELIGLVGITRDISEQKLREQQLRESQKMLRLVLDTIPVRVFWKNRDSIVLGCNRLFAQDAGFDNPDDLLATPPETLQAQTAEEIKFRADEIAIIETGIPKLDYEETLTVNSQETLIIQTSKLPLRNEQGDVIGILGVYNDISERKAQERQLRYFASLQESVVDAVISTDTELHIQTWNRGAERIYGWKADEVIGKLAPDLLNIRRSSTQTIDSVGQALVEQGFIQQETIQSHKDGRDIFIMGSATLLTNENDVPIAIISVNRDISGRKEVERQLRFDASIQANMNDAVIVTDTKFRIQSWNKAAETIYGWSADEAIGETAAILQTHFESPELYNQLTSDLFTNGRWQDEFIQRRKDGSEIYIQSSTSVLKDENGVAIGVVAVNRDITERKQIEQALRKSEELVRTVLNIMPVGVWILDEKGTITFGNPAGQQIWAGAKYVGSESYSVFKAWWADTGKLLEPEEWGAARAIATGKPILNDELEIEAFDGTHKFMLNSAVPLRDSDQKSIGAVVINQEITERKQMEQALRESENRFRSLIEAAPIATVITNDQGQITLFNKQSESIFGYDRGEVIGQSVEMLMPVSFRGIHPGYRDAYMAQPSVRRMSSGKEFNALRKNGTQFPAEIELSYVNTAKGLLVMSFVIDITERKKAEQALRESEMRFGLLVNGVRDYAIYLLDPKGNIVTWNQGAERIKGYTAQEVVGKNIANFYTPEDIEKDEPRRILEIAATEGHFTSEGERVRKDGSRFWAEVAVTALKDSEGHLFAYAKVTRDLTERRKAQETLRLSEARYRLLAENITDVISRVTLDGIYIDVSPSITSVLGYAPEEVTGKNRIDFVHPDDKAALLQKQQISLERRIEAPLTYRFRHRNGHYVWLEVVRKFILSETNTIIEYVTSARDITIRKRAEEALKNALEKEKELNELKTRFVSTASHEFRTPLATILAIVETLLAYRRRLVDEEIDDKLTKITDQITYLKTITEDMLQVVRLQDPKAKYDPTNLNLDALCRSVIDEFESRDNMTQKFVYSCDDSLKEVVLDPKLMRQIISNLVSNAVKYSAPNDTITISLKRSDAVLTIKIQDEGIGIPQADLKHLFEPFHRATNVGTIPGTGLGLVITKESIELHGGFITVDSELGIGTTFTVMIPFADEKKGQTA